MKKKILFAALFVMIMAAILTVSASAASSGYCAVGEVNGDQAAILLENGKVAKVKFSGTVTPDTVCAYTNNGGTYTFTPVAFGGYTTWRLYDVNGGTCFYAYVDGGANDIYASYADKPAFLKLGNFRWKVATTNQVVIPDGMGDFPNTGYPANVDAFWNVDHFDVIYGDATAANSTGLKPEKVMCPDVEAVNVTLSGNVITNGFCAVGEVDTANKKAAILTEDGKILKVCYKGTDPVEDTLYHYSSKNYMYTFEPVTLNGFAAGWRIYDVNGGTVYWDGGATYVTYADKPCFLKLGNHQWKVAKSGQIIINDGEGDFPNTQWPCNVDSNWNVDHVDFVYADGTATYGSGLDVKKCVDRNAPVLDVTLANAVAPETADYSAIIVLIGAIALAGAAVIIKKH